MGLAELSSEASELRRVVKAIRRGKFTEADAERLYDSGRDATKFVVLLTLAARPVERAAAAAREAIAEEDA